jgi:MFS family permease
LDKKVIGSQVSTMFLLQNLGALFGMYLFAMHSERTNRRTALFIWFAAAWVSVLVFFWGVGGSGAEAMTRAKILAPIMGFCTLGPLSGFTIYFPELFPTRLRTTGCGFCYNAARILAAIAPSALGALAAHFARQGSVAGGFPMAATCVTFIYVLGFIGTAMGPETKGKPLPE